VSSKKKIEVRQIEYYFDSVIRDRLDTGGISRRNATLMALREKLVKLPDAQFDAAVKMLEAFLSAPSDVSQSTSDSSRQSQAAEMYEQAKRVLVNVKTAGAEAVKSV